MVDRRVLALSFPKQNIFFLGCKLFLKKIIIKAHELPSYVVELCVVTKSTDQLSHISLAIDEAIYKTSAVSKTTATQSCRVHQNNLSGKTQKLYLGFILSYVYQEAEHINTDVTRQREEKI